MRIGFKLMAEEHGPRELVRQAVRAERAGFDFVEVSDHFHPWLHDQGHSPFAWSVLAAIAERTERIELGTGVTCPSVRYHPAVVAQAAATTALLAGGRHFLGVGSGERLNEHVVGAAWPSVDVRQEMLREGLQIIRLLWSGGYRSFRGRHLSLEDARLFDLPEEPPRLIVAAGGGRAAALAAELGDGLFANEPRSDLVEAYTGAGGAGPRYNEVPLAVGRDRDAALKAAHRMLRFAAGGWKTMAELPNPVNFEAAAGSVTVEQIAGMVSAGPDPGEHLAQARAFADAGYDHLALMNAGGDPDEFLDYCAAELLGPLRAGAG
ncbi:TIGR03557 family F420-dependent LLM class oxidoreductase [Nocardiopsis potens]|uniref:TIGR03557 family F420-dependent LLM class oxidoreductase n=1 Tax=Nocardiopsis potens TaxID=1246458 RepID=UPI000348A476|nr:TIGR03557 family F420-dependent LLM class oxidoreductase [Nocardiopsis potens]